MKTVVLSKCYSFYDFKLLSTVGIDFITNSKANSKNIAMGGFEPGTLT
jgi:hypothetical protein